MDYSIPIFEETDNNGFALDRQGLVLYNLVGSNFSVVMADGRLKIDYSRL